MNRDAFDKLVKRLEPFADKHPRAYFARVVLLALLGYAFWFVLLGGLVGLLVLLGVAAARFPHLASPQVVLVLGLLLLIVIITILRSIHVRIEPPEGFEVHRAQSPELFAVLDEISQKLACARFHHVLLTGEYNAMVGQATGLGVPGWQRNFLIIGLPLLQGLSREQFHAVVAHEFAHLAGNHSRFACWVYRVRRSWEQVLERMSAQQHPGTGLLLRFFQWYAPYFSAYTFVLARANEYEADSWSARLTGGAVAEQALCHVQIHTRLLDESFWPEMMRLACTREHPEIGVFHRLGEKLKEELEPRSAQKWLRQALAAQTSNADTHPCLRDRLLAMGHLTSEELSVSVPPATAPAARADLLLGDTLAACVRALEIRWENGAKTQWRQRYLQAQKERERLQTLATTESSRVLTADESLERARITLNQDGDSAAVPLLQRVLELAPDDAQANFLLGRILIRDDDETGIARLEQAIGQDPDVVTAGLDLLYLYYRRLGLPERMREMEKRYDEHQDILRFAHAEREHVNLNDTFLPHSLSAGQVEAILVQLREYREIQRAYLVRKEMSFFPKKPLYLLVVELSDATPYGETTATDRAFVNRLAEILRLPGQTLIFTPTGGMEPVGRIIRLESWTHFYEKKPRQTAA